MQPIFITSTFRDMQAERDMLNLDVLPDVREFARQRGEAVEFIDLRWGIDTSALETEEGAQKVLSVCLDEIHRSRPYLIALIGQRYGYIPPKDLVRSAVEKRKEEWADLKDLEMSITALEIEYGAFSRNGQPERCLFYYREPIDESLVSPEQRINYLPESKEHAKKLEKLKKRIGKLAAGRVKSYRCSWDAERGRVTGLDELERMVKDDLKGLLEKEFGEPKKLTWQEMEQQEAQLIFNERSAVCTAREEQFRGYAEEITGTDVRLWVLRGESGSGKSVAIGRVAEELKDMGREVFAFVCGQSGGSSTGADIVKQAVYHMETLLGQEHFVRDESEAGRLSEDRGDILKEWKDRWTGLMYEYDKRGLKPVVYVIDALDQLIQDNTVEEFKWLPDGMPASIRVVVSCLSSFKLPENLRFRSRVLIRQLGPMDEQDKALVVKGLEKNARKELAEEVKARLASLPQSENPLYLSMMHQRFLMLDSDDFKEISKIGKEDKAIKKHMLKLIDDAPADVGEVCRMIMQEASSRINEEQSTYILRLLAASRSGLREVDVRSIFTKQGMQYNALDYSRLRKYMRPYFGELGDGRVDFTHESIREGYRSDIGTVNLSELNRVIYEHLEELDDDDPVHQAEYVHFAYLNDKKVALVKRIEGYREGNLERAGAELHDICIADDGSWLTNLLEDSKTRKISLGLIGFVLIPFYNSFTMSIAEMLKLLPVMLQNSYLCEHYAHNSGTPESRVILGFSLSKVGDIYWRQGSLDEAMKMYLKGLAIGDQIAIEQKTLAMRELLSRLNNDIGNILRDQGELDLALEAYYKGLEIIKQVAQESGTPESRRDLCRSYNLLGVHHYRQGKYYNALENFSKCLDISEQLAKELGTLETRKDLGASYQSVGDVYERQRKYSEAINMYQKAFDVSEQLANELGTPESRRSLGLSYNKVGNIYGKQHKYDKALEMFLRGFEIMEQLEKELGTPESRMELGISFAMIGDIYMQQGRLDTALEMFLRGYEIMEQFAREFGTPESRRYLGIFYSSIGNIHRQKGKLNAALEMCLKAFEINEQLVNKLKTPSSQMELAVDYSNLGYIYIQLGRLDTALEMYLNNLEICKQLAKDLDTPESRRELGIACKSAGDVYNMQSRYDEAIKMYLRDLEINQQLVKELGIQESHIEIVVKYGSLGDIYRQRGMLDEALEIYQKGFALSAELVKELGTPESRYNLGVLCNSLGGIHRQQGRLDMALEMCLKGFEIFEQLATELGTPESSRDLGISCGNVGVIYEEQGRYDEALEKYLKGLEVSEQLANESRTIERCVALGFAFNKVGDIYKQQGKFDEALDMFRKCLGIRKTIYEELHTINSATGLVSTFFDIGLLLIEQDKLDEAKAIFLQSIAILEGVIKQDTSDEVIFFLSKIYVIIGNLYKQGSKKEEALGMYKSNEALREKALEKRNTTNGMMELDLACEKVADLCAEMGLLEESKVHNQRRLMVLRALVEEVDHPTFRNQIVVVSCCLAATCFDLEQGEEARAHFQEALEIAEESCVKFPEDEPLKETLVFLRSLIKQ